MKKVLYVNGCSHSCGAEISYPGSHRTPEDLAGSWGGQLADRFGLVHYNDAISGQDNQAIVSTTIHSILKLLDQYKPEEILIVIGWTGLERDHYIYENTRYRFVPGCQKLPFFNNWPEQVKNTFHNWVMGVDLKNGTHNKFALIYFSLVNFLKQYGIDYYCFNALHAIQYPEQNLLHELDHNRPTIKIFDQIKNDINYFEPLTWEYTYFEYMKARYDPHIDGRNFHFVKSAQTDWANILASKIASKIS